MVCSQFCPLLSLFQRRRWVSLWTHSSTVTRSTLRLSTGERWQCVEVNTVCCCWLYWYTGKARGSPPLFKQLARCGLHHTNDATNHTATPVHQFHLTINLQRTVEPQYCTDLLPVHYNLKLETFRCNSLNKLNVFILLGFQKCGWVLKCCTWPCETGHCVSDCRNKMCVRKWTVDLSCTGLRTDCSTADCILVQ